MLVVVFQIALDILRLAVRFPSIANMCCSGSEGDNLTAYLLACTRYRHIVSLNCEMYFITIQ